MLRAPVRLVLAVVLCQASACALAATLRVPEEFPTIQAALHAARAGDTVLVGPGTYRENLQISGSIVLRSSAGAERTVIDAGGTGPAIVARGTGGEHVTIAGFTITNGLSTLEHMSNAVSRAGGITADAMVLSIRANIIRNNVGCMGNAISTSATAVTIERNQIIDNSQHASCDGANGGGMFLNGDGRGESVVAGNVIARNGARGYGGGIAVQAMNRLTIRDNLLSGNQAPVGYGGGLVLLGGSVTISRNMFVGNFADSGGAMALFPNDNADRSVAEGNLMTGNNATTDSSAALLVPVLQENLRFTDNIADGDSALQLIVCMMPGYVIAPSNTLRNAGGPLVGEFCVMP